MPNAQGRMANAKGRMPNAQGRMANAKGRMRNAEGGMANAKRRMPNAEGRMANGDVRTVHVRVGSGRRPSVRAAWACRAQAAKRRRRIYIRRAARRVHDPADPGR